MTLSMCLFFIVLPISCTSCATMPYLIYHSFSLSSLFLFSFFFFFSQNDLIFVIWKYKDKSWNRRNKNNLCFFFYKKIYPRIIERLNLKCWTKLKVILAVSREKKYYKGLWWSLCYTLDFSNTINIIDKIGEIIYTYISF